MRRRYLEKIRTNPGILFGRVSRQEMLETILPETSVYLLPTYNEAFGFAILESMPYGIPVVTTNQLAIPEMIEHGKSGLLVDISKYDTQRMFRGYVVDQIPDNFKRDVNEELMETLETLIVSRTVREELGKNALWRARDKFGFANRNSQMERIYRQTLA